MGIPGKSLLDRAMTRRALARWRAAAHAAPQAELEDLHQQRQQARQLRGALDDLVNIADYRLAMPRIGSNTFPRPGGTLWSWRPKLWRGALGTKGIAGVETRTRLGREATLFHDCATSEITLRQVRNQREADLAPFALRMDVFRFDGSFLSLALDCPEGAVEGLQKRHLIQLSTIMEVEKPIEIFARLNIRHGPNTEQITLELPASQGEIMVEFDLAYSQLNEKRVQKMWVDLIFEGPEMNQITIRDLTFARYPRAEF